MIFSLVLLFILVGRVLKSASNNNPLLESGRDPSWDPLPKIYSVYDVNERIPDAASSVARVLKTGIRSRETIFVSVAAYRDDLCSKTINELFSKADDWTKIFVGVCDQIDERSNDKGCLTGIDPKFESHIRVIQMPADEGKGPTYARYLVSQLWDGEEFFLMIDSHSEFADKWDSLVHDQLVKRMKHRKTAFSHYPANINSGILGKIGHDPTWICGAHFKDGAPQGLTIQRASGCHAKHRYEGLCTSPFIGAGFFFAPAYEFLSDVPFDPYL